MSTHNSESESVAPQQNTEVNVSTEFQENVIKFVKIDDLTKKKQKEMSELRTQKKPCEEYVLSYLDQIGETVIEITSGKLRKNKSETKVPLTIEIIKQAIETEVTDPIKVAKIMKKMDDLRPKNVRTNLKRTSNHDAKK